MTVVIRSGRVERSTQTGTEEPNRLRWQCRRGLLELDLVLEHFLERHLDQLQGEYLASFKTLLDYTDNDLLDLIRARRVPRCATRRGGGMDAQLLRPCQFWLFN